MKPAPIFKSAAGRDEIQAVYDSLLDRWPVPYEMIQVPTRCGQTFVLACGEKSAPPLILLHGSSSNSAMWIGDAAVYARYFRVYAVDIPGEPGKSEAVRYEMKGTVYADWIHDIFGTLQIQRAAVLGISLGGWLGLRFASVYPDQVEKLVLLCPGGVAPQKLSFALGAIPMLFLGEKGIDRVTRIVYGDLPIHEETLAYTKVIARNFNPRMSIPLFSDEELKRITMPVLLIAGEQDALLPSKKTAARLQKLLPCLTVHLDPAAGHVLLNQTGRVLEFLKPEKELFGHGFNG